MMGEVFFSLMLCIFLCMACYFDYRFCRIPNWLVVLILGLGLVKAYWTGGPYQTWNYVLWGSVMLLALYPLFRIGTMGGGDLKLYAVCCGFFPREKILSFLFFSLLIAALFSLFRFIRRADLKERFAYLLAYVKSVADSGEWKLYFSDVREKKKAGICLAGPILLSVLLYWGGFY